MGILAVTCVLFGMALGQFFKWFILFPACGLASILVLINPMHIHNGLLGSFLQFGVVITTLQIGYFAGLVMHDHFRSAPKLSPPVRDIPQMLARVMSAVRRRRPTGGRPDCKF
ncbi:hypothetical protein [Methylocella sp.]|uniref:hypothetical protein n=1 Tax=Methylocella sp. TaxID=1978226 RepID=UPI003C160341